MFNNWPRKKNIVLGIFVPVLAFSLFGSLNAALFSGCQDPKKGKANLEIWNVYDDSDVFAPLIKAFNKDYPNVKITYHKESQDTYETDLVNALAAGRGPTIFAVQNFWLPKHIDKLAPASSDIFTVKEYQDTFVDVAVNDFVASPPSQDQSKVLPEQIYAVPLYVDTLALYWNKDIFNSEGIAQPPANWNEFNDTVSQLTKRDESGNIVRSGAAIGTASNVNRASDILGLLMLQTGAKMVDDKKKNATFDQAVTVGNKTYQPGQSSLEFYTSFANSLKQVYTWNDKMHYSIDAFAEGSAAMMINYSYHIATIEAKDPHLRFAIAPLPQPKDAQVEVNFANYWGLGVSSAASANDQQYAWIFLKWLTDQPQSQTYLEKVNRPTARRDLVSWQENDSQLGVFAKQSLSARSWYQKDNLAIEKIFNNMISGVVSGRQTVSDALHQGDQQVTLLMGGGY